MAAPKKYKPNISSGEVHEPQAPYGRNAGFVFESEDDRLLRDASLPPPRKTKKLYQDDPAEQDVKAE
jgi:hypothetical protein